jgi:hypothetical protein
MLQSTAQRRYAWQAGHQWQLQLLTQGLHIKRGEALQAHCTL